MSVSVFDCWRSSAHRLLIQTYSTAVHTYVSITTLERVYAIAFGLGLCMGVLVSGHALFLISIGPLHSFPAHASLWGYCDGLWPLCGSLCGRRCQRSQVHRRESSASCYSTLYLTPSLYPQDTHVLPFLVSEATATAVRLWAQDPLDVLSAMVVDVSFAVSELRTELTFY